MYILNKIILLIVALTISSCCVFRKNIVKYKEHDIKIDTTLYIPRSEINTKIITLRDSIFIEHKDTLFKLFSDTVIIRDDKNRTEILFWKGKYNELNAKCVSNADTIFIEKIQKVKTKIKTEYKKIEKIPFWIWIVIGFLCFLLIGVIIKR